MLVDLFCGAGGASDGIAMATGEHPLGIERDKDSARSHHAAGHLTIQADVSTTAPVAAAGLWASPPCTAFSRAGKKRAYAYVDRLLGSIDAEKFDPWPDVDPTVWLALEIGRWVHATKPRWVACEQVPQAIGAWKAYRSVLERWGYSAWCGVLSSEQWGVPQVRQRAFLMASLDREVSPPEPTHQAYRRGEPQRSEQSLFGTLKPWVSMAEALGWVEGRVGFARVDDKGTSTDGYRERDWRQVDEPAFNLTEKARSWVLDRRADYVDGAPTIRPWPLDSPAPTITGESLAGTWQLRGGIRHPTRGHTCYGTTRGLSEPAPTIQFGKDAASWVFEAGDEVARVTVRDALALQGFCPARPLSGSRTSRFRQIGNAVPPPMAKAIVGQLVS